MNWSATSNTCRRNELAGRRKSTRTATCTDLGPRCTRLTGRAPGEGKTLVEKVTRIRQIMPEKPTKFQMSIPPTLEGLVLKLLAKEPKDRFPTAADLVKELERFGKNNGVTA